MSGTVSTASIICMVIQVLISVGLPVAMLIIFRKKTKAQLVWTLIGMCTFVLFALIIESIFHRVMIDIFGESLTGNVWVYGIYGGIAAGVFEETGRYLAMKFLDKGNLNKQNSITRTMRYNVHRIVLINCYFHWTIQEIINFH